MAPTCRLIAHSLSYLLYYLNYKMSQDLLSKDDLSKTESQTMCYETNSCMNIFPLDAAVVQVSNPVLLTSESQPLLNSLSQTLFRENINKDEHKEKED